MTFAADSSSPGYLSPLASGPLVLEGEALDTFLHDLVAGTTGLAPELVRPRWQPEPPNLPPAGSPWASVGVIERENDAFPAVLHDGAGNGGEGADNFQRHERLNIIVSFFDLGAGGQADAFCALLRDGLSIRQNQEQLMLNGFAFVSCGTPVAVPSLLKERWQYRVDLPVQLRRAIARSYPVDNLLKAAGTIEAAFSSGIEKELPFETPNQQG